jgi:hypothetical protein
MSKVGRPKQSKKKKAATWQIVVIVMVLGGLASSWFLVGRDSAGEAAAVDESAAVKPEPPPPGLENRMILPAKPQPRRPVTLNPAAFADPETKNAYQAAKDVPEVLEYMPCYCGCFGNAGHRNNLDCFKDNHGVTCSLCRAIAIEANRQSKLGTPVQQIKRIVDERWAPRIR